MPTPMKSLIDEFHNCELFTHTKMCQKDSGAGAAVRPDDT